MCNMCKNDVFSLLPPPELARRVLVPLNAYAFEFGAAAGSHSSGVDQNGLNF